MKKEFAKNGKDYSQLSKGLLGTAIQPIAALEAGHEFTGGEDESEEEDKSEAKKQTVEESIDPEDIPF